MGNTTIAVLEEVTQVVEIVLPGPQGPVGDIHPSMPGLVQQATDAATSATASALSADTSEANASASAAAALASANAASESATVASAKAGEASASAATASTKASEASASASNAADSAAAAATSATDTANALVGERSAVATLTNKTITSPVIDSGAANGVAYLNGSKVLTAGSGLAFDGSGLAVGAAPASGIRVYARTSALSGTPFYADNGSAGNSGFKVQLDSGITTILNDFNSPLAFGMNNVEQMRLTHSGLGIGTSSPSAKIVTAQSGGGNTAYASVDSWSDDFQTSRSGIGFNARIDHTAYSQAAVQLDAAKSGWLIQGRNAPGAEAVYDWFSVSRVSPTGVSTKMLDLDASGNLGLGVTPSAWFGTWKAIQVGASGALSSRSDVFGTLLSQNAFIGPTGDFSYIGNDAASSYTLIGAEHRWSIAPSGTAGQPISFTQAMTLDASGRLLIGGTSSGAGTPASSIQVPVGSHFSSGSFGRIATFAQQIGSVPYAGLYGLTTTYNAYYSDGWKSLGGGTASAFTMDEGIFSWASSQSVGAHNATLTWTTRMTLDASGNLGIGTNSPTQRVQVGTTSTGLRNLLRVAGNYNFDGAYLGAAGSNGGGALELISHSSASDSSGWQVSHHVDAAPGCLVFSRADSVGSFGALSYVEKLRLDSSGNLGIGTSSPISRLHVTGDVRAAGNLILVGGAGTPEVQFFQSSRNWTIRNNAGALEVYDATASAARVTFDASGNLGLGVTPSAWSSLSALHVKGTAHFAGFSSGAEGAFVTSNAYFNGTNWLYQMAAAASYFRQSGGAHQWFTAPSGAEGTAISFTQAMTLSASGGLMVGTSTDYGERLHVSSAGAGDVISMRIAASQENGSNGMARRIQWSLRGSTGSLINTNSIRSEWSDVGANSAKLVFTSAANNAQSDAMTLDASGNLLVGATAFPSSAVAGVGLRNPGSGAPTISAGATSSNTFMLAFVNTNGTVGTISSSGSSTAYNTSSDYRLKNITGPVTNSGEYIDSLNPVEGSWKADGSPFVGLIAHEVQEVSRTQVATGVKDGEQMQAMDYSASELIANMIAELKSLRARVAALESR